MNSHEMPFGEWRDVYCASLPHTQYSKNAFDHMRLTARTKEDWRELRRLAIEVEGLSSEDTLVVICGNKIACSPDVIDILDAPQALKKLPFIGRILSHLFSPSGRVLNGEPIHHR